MSGDRDESSTSRRAATLAAGVTFLVFLPSLLAGFVYDDVLLVAENPYAQSLKYVARGFRTHLWDVYAFGPAGIGLRYYRPLVTASYVLNWCTSQGAPWAFHLVNVLCHTLATFLAARLATRWTRSAALGLVAGLLFGLHPSRTESVIWVSGRTDVMMALFTLLAVEVAHRTTVGAASDPTRPARGRQVALVVGAALLTVASILSKEAGALTALLCGVDFLIEDPGSPERKRLRRAVVVLGGIGAAYLLFRSLGYPVRRGEPFELTLKYGFFTVWAYVERIVLPWPQTFFYRPVESVGGVPHYPPLVLGLGALVSVATGALLRRAWKRDRVALAILLTALALIFPLLNFSYTGIYVTTSDHFLYLPLFVFAVGLLRLYRDAALRVADARVWRVALVGVLVLYAAVDAVRVLDYRNDYAFWEHEIEVNSDNPVALQNMSRLLARDGEIRPAYALMQRVVAPSATRFFLLAGDEGMVTDSRARLLALRAALLADGDVRALGAVFAELESLLRRMLVFEAETTRKHNAQSVKKLRPIDPKGGLNQLLEGGHLNAVAETALIGTRLGRVTRARELAAAVSDDVFWMLASPENFVLTLGRVGAFARAQRLVQLGAASPPGVHRTASPEAFAALGERVRRAELLMRDASAKPDDASARTDRALAYAELGAYIPALKSLRPVFESTPHASTVDPLYVQLLVSARLDQEALATTTRLLGPEKAAAAVAELRAQLSPFVRALPAAEEPSPWREP